MTNSVVNEHSVIMNRFLSQIGPFSTEINPVITNPGYNEFDCIINQAFIHFSLTFKMSFKRVSSAVA